jgi:hypothetical protein
MESQRTGGQSGPRLAERLAELVDRLLGRDPRPRLAPAYAPAVVRDRRGLPVRPPATRRPAP